MVYCKAYQSFIFEKCECDSQIHCSRLLPPPPLKKIISIYLNYNSKFLSLCTVICLGIPLIVKFLWILIYIKYEEDTASLGWYDNYTLSNLLGWRSRFKSSLNTIPIK